MMPAEIVTKIFCMLPSLSDVLAIATTCRQFRNFWSENISVIYGSVGLRSIPCELHARRLLADQSSTQLGVSVSSARDVLRLLRNACVVEKAILQFEREFVCRVKCGGCPIPKSYLPVPPARRHHPPYLTRAERPRFIRIYYQLWGLMKMDAAEWPDRLESTRLKDLCLLFEMCRLTQSIGKEEPIALPKFPNADPNSANAINWSRSQKRIDLSTRIWTHIEHTYQQLHHAAPERIDIYASQEGWPPFVAIWDHWQPCLKDWVCRAYASEPMKEELWDESSDEEL